MKQENINYLAVGSFVLAMLILLMFGLYHVTGQRSDTERYFVTMDNVSGIREGTTVTFSGFDIGQVHSITPQRRKGQTSYELALGIRPGWPIPADSQAQVVMPSLLGEKQINISEGSSQSLLEPGEEIDSVAAVDMINLMASVSTEFEELSRVGLLPLLRNMNEQIVNTLPPMAHDARTLLNSLNTSAERLNQMLNPSNQKRMAGIMTNAEDMTANLNRVSRRLNTTGDKIDDLLNSASTVMSENDEDIRKTVLDLRATMEAVTERIDSIMFNLDNTSRNLNEFSRQLRSNPGVIINSEPPQDMTESHR